MNNDETTISMMAMAAESADMVSKVVRTKSIDQSKNSEPRLKEQEAEQEPAILHLQTCLVVHKRF